MLVRKAAHILVWMLFCHLCGDLCSEIPYVIGELLLLGIVGVQFRLAFGAAADALQAVLWREGIYLHHWILVKPFADVSSGLLDEFWICEA